MSDVTEAKIAEVVARFKGAHDAPIRPEKQIYVPHEALIGELLVFHQNLTTRINRLKQSALAQRARVRELQRLLSAFQALSLDTREMLSEIIIRRIDATCYETSDTLKIYDPTKATGAVQEAVNALLNSFESKLSRSTKRGRGRAAIIRRFFVREAAALYVMAGFKRLGASERSLFMQWLNTLWDAFDMPAHLQVLGDKEFGQHTNFKRIVREVVGTTRAKRNRYYRALVQNISRKYPSQQKRENRVRKDQRERAQLARKLRRLLGSHYISLPTLAKRSSGTIAD